MPYLIIKDNEENVLVDKAGENIFMRIYPMNYSQRTNVICKSIYNEYTVAEKKGSIQIVYRTSKNSVIHLSEEGTFFAKKTLLEDFENNYNISNLKLLCDKKNYLFYCAVNPYENTNDLIFHIFSNNEEKAPQALLSLPQLHSKYQCEMIDDKIYLMTSIYQDQRYELNFYIYNIEMEQWEEFETLFTSEYPITDFCFVKKNNEISISYVIEQYGHYSLYYAKKDNRGIRTTEIYSAGQKMNCILFIYNKVIWINYKINDTLFYSFSTNNGRDFSEGIKCTVQNNSVDNIKLLLKNKPSLIGNNFFGYIGKHPYVVILSQIDVDNILFYSGENTELKKLLEVTFDHNPGSGKKDEFMEEINRLRKVEQEIYDKYNELVQFTKEVQAEGKKWKKKYKRVERENKQEYLQVNNENDQSDDYLDNNNFINISGYKEAEVKASEIKPINKENSNEEKEKEETED